MSLCVSLSVQCLQRPEEGSRHPKTGALNGCELPCGFWVLHESSARSARALNCCSVFSVPRLDFTSWENQESIIVRGKGRVWVIQNVKCLSRELRPCSKACEGISTGIIQGSAYVKLIMNINMALCDGQIWFVGGYYRSLG